MFDSIGWFEILFILIVGLIIIGPEKLPGVIEDVRAGIYAARRAINNAKKELNGELGDLGAEFEDFRGPINQIATLKTMGPRAAITKALFDGDDSYLDDFDPKKLLGEEELRGQTQPRTPPATSKPTEGNAESPTTPTQPQNRDFNWEDVT